MSSCAYGISPAAYTGTHDHLKSADFFPPIIQLCKPGQLSHLPGRPNLSRMGMAGKLKVHTRLCIFRKIYRLMVQKEHKSIAVCLPAQLLYPGPSLWRDNAPDRGVCSSDDSQLIVYGINPVL